MSNTTANLADTSTLGKPSGNAFGYDYFSCTNDEFQNSIMGRQKHKKWEAFLTKNKVLSDNIKSYIKANKNKNFMLKNSRTGEFVFADARFNIL